MSSSIKDKCKYCKKSISPEYMLLHVKYAHPERLGNLSAKNKKYPSKTKASKNKVKGYVNPDGTVECVLCHKLINYPELEVHMQSEHKASWQQHINYLRAPRAQNNRWVTFCQGGGPGLGKKK